MHFISVHNRIVGELKERAERAEATVERGQQRLAFFASQDFGPQVAALVADLIAALAEPEEPTHEDERDREDERDEQEHHRLMAEGPSDAE